jgi:integrase
MARKLEGTVRVRLDDQGKPRWFAKFTRHDSSRSEWEALDPKIPLDDRPAAKAAARRMARGVWTKSANNGRGESVEDYSKRWLASRSAKTARDNGSHLEHHVLPIIRNVPMREVTSAHGDAIVAKLDEKIASGAISDKTARNIWGTARKMMREAAHAKPATGLRCIEVNPFRDVSPPERSKVKKAKQFLFPSEVLALFECPKVPRKWKRNVAIAVYLGLRDGEQRALRWKHVDLVHGTVYVCETFDRETSAARDGTKTDAPRTIPIPAPLLPLLEAMSAEVDGTGLVCRNLPSQRAMARGLRWLRHAGVTRASLFESSSVNLNLRWHDLRASCGTWLAVAGKTGPEIRDLLGHTQTSMTDRYLRNATAVRSGQFGEVFPPLPETVVGISPRIVPERYSKLVTSGNVGVFGGVDGTRILKRTQIRWGKALRWPSSSTRPQPSIPGRSPRNRTRAVPRVQLTTTRTPPATSRLQRSETPA